MYVNVPMLDIQSIGAGTGTYIRVDQYTNRLKLGPDSAGGTPGPVFQDAGNETPTIGDCDLILGIINPDYYLGGRVKVYKAKAEAIFQEKVSGPLGLDMHTAAEQCVDLVNIMMREHLVRSLMLGFDIRDYVLAGYGGAGPMHLCGFAGDDAWKGVITVPYAAAFSAWGCACMDYAHRRHRSVSAMIAYGADEASKMYTATAITAAWEQLENQLLEELTGEGFSRDQIKLKQFIYMRYYGQLDDLEVESPVTRLTSADDVDKLVTTFEGLFTRTYTLAGKPPFATFLINEVAVTAQVETNKPVIVKHDLEGPEPPKAAFKEVRTVFQRGQWHDANIYEMDELRPGNEITGLSVIEAPSTTLFLPLDWHAKLDENLIFRLERR
jgi:N-methylhydantoinase A/oxoprolinase/acetone carboxylase beta subunit